MNVYALIRHHTRIIEFSQILYICIDVLKKAVQSYLFYAE